jgi:hypothetical protein
LLSWLRAGRLRVRRRRRARRLLRWPSTRPRLLLWRPRLGVAAVLGMLDIDVDARAALTAALS